MSPNLCLVIGHIEPDQYIPWNNSTNKSQAPEDGCINIRNMLSIKQRNNKASYIKLVSLYSTIRSDAIFMVMQFRDKRTAW